LLGGFVGFAAERPIDFDFGFGSGRAQAIPGAIRKYNF